VPPTLSQLNTVAIAGLCRQHADESRAWLDYRITPALRFGSGAARDDTLDGARDRQRARYTNWRATVVSQQQLIEDACAVHCSAGRIVTVPVDWDALATGAR
jgi:hypothetical protein